MKKKLFFAAFLALLAVSGAASAQHCTYIQGRPPLCWGAPQGGFVQQPLVQQQVVPAGINLPNGFSQCQLVGAIAGGTIGSLARNHTTQAVILAGLAGGLAGNYLCTNSQGQRVQVIGQQAPQTVAGQGVTVTRGQSQTTMFECNFNDGRPVILVARAEDCREFARQEVVQAPQQQDQAPQPQQTQGRGLVFSGESGGPGVCRLMSDGTARTINNPTQALPRGHVIALSEKTPDAGSATISPKNPEEDCTAWRFRVGHQLLWRG